MSGNQSVKVKFSATVNGITAIAIITVNKYTSEKEKQRLSNYVQAQLFQAAETVSNAIMQAGFPIESFSGYIWPTIDLDKIK